MNEIEPIKTEETHRQLQSTESVDINFSQITIKT